MTRVLLVEDNPADVYLTTRLLRPWNVVVHHAASMREASALVPAGYDVILTDLDLGDSWGDDTIRKFQELAPGTPVVAICGSTDIRVEDAVRALDSGFLIKGVFDVDDLLREVAQARALALA